MLTAKGFRTCWNSQRVNTRPEMHRLPECVWVFCESKLGFDFAVKFEREYMVNTNNFTKSQLIEMPRALFVLI